MIGARVTAKQLNDLLAYRHVKDVYVPECKMGAAGSRTLDGWALLPTWSPLTTIGYEIKVSRSDWLQDQKYEEYRTVCHQFFVVAPKGVVQAGELPEGVGLLEPIGQGTGRRLVMRTKATRQQPEDLKLVRLMAHVLMWRKDTRDLGTQTRESRAAFWRSWVDEQKDFDAIGRNVKGRMRQILRNAIDAQRRAEAHAERLADAAAMLKELGVTLEWNHYTTRRNIADALKAGASETIADLNATIERLAGLRNRIEAATRESTECAS